MITPAKTEVAVRLRGPDGRVLDETKAVTGDFGTLHGSLQLPLDGPVGDHRIELVFASATFGEKVVVKAFRKPEYRVSVRPRKRVIRPGEEVEVDVQVDYFFGGPVGNARVEWSVTRDPLKIDRDRYLSLACRCFREDAQQGQSQCSGPGNR